MAVRALPLAKALAACGHEVLLLLPPWDQAADAGQEWLDGGVRVRNVILPPRVPLAFHLALTWRLVREVLRFRPDVVHCFKPKSYAGLTAWALWHLRRAGRTAVRLVVDADDWEGAGGWNELAQYSGLQKRFFAWQESWGLRHCDALTVASRALETIAWSRGVPPGRVRYLPNGCWPEPERASERGDDGLREKYGLGDAPVVLLYTRFFEYSISRALAIMQALVRQVPEARWLVVGKGFFGEEEELLAEARASGAAEWLVYAGWVRPDQLPDHFAVAQVAIYPFDDTLINRCKCAVKLIDLLAAGVPVVADAVGQNREYIQDGVSGRLVVPGDTVAFARRVAGLLRDPSAASRLGRAARQRVQGDFAWPALAQRLETAYRLAIASGQ